ncbi:hypothetical protein HKCCE3408_01165 [Rhodobacterales bacterium HKCCE3408]|nr:hypothetical protein [Rhodobacterales bacterium HKCCE3408]
MGWILLILGLALWSGAHLFKRVAPARRAAMGDKAKGLVALALLVSVVLMTIGYRNADGAFFWGRHPATVGINNLLMLLAFYLFAASGMKTAITRRIRHPQLTAVKIWAVAHILVNGDMPSFVLFGGLLAWAVVEVIVINRSVPAPAPNPPASAGKEIGAVVGAIVVMIVVMLIHYWLGVQPWG